MRFHNPPIKPKMIIRLKKGLLVQVEGYTKTHIILRVLSLDNKRLRIPKINWQGDDFKIGQKAEVVKLCLFEHGGKKRWHPLEVVPKMA